MIAKKPTERAQTGKGYPTATYGRAVEFERLLKPFKGGVSGSAGGEFTGFQGGAENA